MYHIPSTRDRQPHSALIISVLLHAIAAAALLTLARPWVPPIVPAEMSVELAFTAPAIADEISAAPVAPQALQLPDAPAPPAPDTIRQSSPEPSAETVPPVQPTTPSQPAATETAETAPPALATPVAETPPPRQAPAPQVEPNHAPAPTPRELPVRRVPQVRQAALSRPARAKPPAAAASSPARQPARPTPAAAQPVAAPTVDGIWRNGFADWLARHRTYPDSARRDGLEGRATIRVTINRDGAVIAAAMVSSTGVPVLDRAVDELLSALRQAHFPFPPNMENDSVDQTVTLRYALTP